MLRPLRALTLVELLVVLLLLGLAAGMVQLSAAASSQTARLRAAAGTIESQFRLARQYAKTQHRTATIEFDLEQSRIGTHYAGDEQARWRALDGVRMERFQFRDAGTHDRSTRVRISAGGCWLPWELTLAIGERRTRLASDGVRVQFHEIAGDSP